MYKKEINIDIKSQRVRLFLLSEKIIFLEEFPKKIYTSSVLVNRLEIKGVP